MFKQGMTIDDYIKYLQGMNKEIGDSSLLFGIISAYPVFMVLAVFTVIAICMYQLKVKGIPTRDFEIGLIIVVPAAVLGASIFGKIFLPNYQQWSNVFKIVFFWEPGTSFFGCLFFGVVSGLIWFSYRSKETRISTWVYFDIIVVNILIGQAIGRWGNLYNHEIMGWDVDYDQIKWLPSFIRNRLFYFPNFGEFKTINGEYLPLDWVSKYKENTAFLTDYVNASNTLLSEVVQEKIQFKAPIFLIEGILNITLWLILTFGVKNIHKVINYKNNPWVTQPKAFPIHWNKNYKSLPQKEIVEWPTLSTIKYKKTKEGELTLSLKNVWRKAFFWKTPDYEQNVQLFNKNEEWKKQYNIDKKKLSKKMFKDKYNIQIRIFNINPYSKEITKANNPENFKVIMSGVLTGCYIFGYGLIRIVLETSRRPTEYIISNHPIADFIVLSLILTIGIFIICINQFISPKKWREVGWLYEKSY
ncbi:prolipoprotein diacylglyceryl transferase family protein [Mesoplasma corruscae]|uniref:Prolipoprotein diacylglyceryl transferase n=1 Tax=Mesoplasma corruscae TaxID=216874 RepID=A0A2S5RHB8_9MOLU|nr:prolipoprotein diacylglyceryl transferase family protein [Mesoplasma corruscae]PPE06612.1 prolipoprotein diacylglyceryl transferase [Mesoplasma corruscae]